MIVYVVVCGERHRDPQVEVYRDNEVAVARGRALCHMYAGPHDVEEHSIDEENGLVFNASWGEEGDWLMIWARSIR